MAQQRPPSTPASKDLHLLALDGGGVRGLSSLLILENLLERIDPDNPPKPCDYFDMIGGTSTGGLIALMLGRLRMSISDAIAAYLKLSNAVFTKKRHRADAKGQLRGRFDHKALEDGVKGLLEAVGLPKEVLLKEAATSDCKTYYHVQPLREKSLSANVRPGLYAQLARLIRRLLSFQAITTAEEVLIC